MEGSWREDPKYMFAQDNQNGYYERTGQRGPDTYLQPYQAVYNKGNYQRNRPIRRNPAQHDSGVSDIDSSPEISPSENNGLGSRSSGVGASPPSASSLRQSSPSQVVINPLSLSMAKTRRPDSLAAGGPVYEELPGYKNGQPMYYTEPNDSNELPLGKMNTTNNNVTETVCNGGDPSLIGRPFRKRQNPLYDEADHINDIQKDGSNVHPDWLVYVCVCLAMVGLIAIVALVLVILLTTGIIGPGHLESSEPSYLGVINHPNKSQLEVALKRIEDLEIQYAALLNKNTRLESALVELAGSNQTALAKLTNTNITLSMLIDLTESHNDQITNLSKQVSVLTSEQSQHSVTLTELQEESTRTQEQVSQLENLNSRVSIVESSLSLQSSQVGNIVTQLDSFTGTLTALQTNVQESVNELTLSLSSKGSFNVSTCTHERRERGTPIGLPYTYTPWIPQIVDGNVIIGAECSTDHGATSFLELDDINGATQYRCKCSGNVDSGSNADIRYCFIDLWYCPLVA